MTNFSTKSNCYKCEFDIDLSPQRTIDTVHFFGPYRPQFDPHFVKSEVLEELEGVIVHIFGWKLHLFMFDIIFYCRMPLLDILWAKNTSWALDYRAIM